VFLEDYEGRGLFTQCLAEVEVLRRKRKRTLYVTTLVDATNGGGLRDDSGDGPAPVGSVVEVEAEGEASVGELKKRLLQHFGLVNAGGEVAGTRLRVAADELLGDNGAAFGEVLVDEALSLDDAKVKDGFSLVLERGARAGKGEVTLRFKAVAGNDPNAVGFAFRGGKSGDSVRWPRECQELEVTVKDSVSVFDLKVAMCAAAVASGDLVPPALLAAAVKAAGNTDAASAAAAYAEVAAASAATLATAAEAKVATLQGKKKKEARAAMMILKQTAADATLKAEEARAKEAVAIAAAAAAASAAAEDPAALLAKQRRLRLTNWAEEPGALVEETKEGPQVKSSSSGDSGGKAWTLQKSARALTKAAAEAERLVGTLQGKKKKEARVAAAAAALKAADAAAVAAAADAKDAAAQEAKLSVGGWAARAESLAPLTVKEALAGLAAHEVFWLEEGRVPRPGELKVTVLLWQPCSANANAAAAAAIAAIAAAAIAAEGSDKAGAAGVAEGAEGPGSSSSSSSSSSNQSHGSAQASAMPFGKAARLVKEGCLVKLLEVEAHAEQTLAQLCAAVALQLTAPAPPDPCPSGDAAEGAGRVGAAAAGWRVAAPGLTGAAALLAARVAATANRAEASAAAEAADAALAATLAAEDAAAAKAEGREAAATKGGAASAAGAAAAACSLSDEASAAAAALAVHFASGARCFGLRELRADEGLPGKWLGSDAGAGSLPPRGLDLTPGLAATLARLQLKTGRPLVLVPVWNDDDDDDAAAMAAAAEAARPGGAAGAAVNAARAWLPAWLSGSDGSRSASVGKGSGGQAAAGGRLWGAMLPPTATKGCVDLWVTRRDAVPLDSSSSPLSCAPLAWPPVRCLVAAPAGAPTFDQLLAAAAAAAGVSVEDAVVARHDKASWVVLAAGMASSSGGSKKGNKKGKVSGGGGGSAGAKGSSSGGARNVTQAPFNVKHGDLIGIIDRRALAAAAEGSEASPSSSAERWWESNTPASSEEWARAFDAPADREARDAAAAAAAAAAAGGGGSKKGSGKKPKEKEIALEIGAAKDWECDSDDDDEGDELDENDEAFGEDAD
jgi:hypothetical protein